MTVVRRNPIAGTRERLLDAAERLFAERGLAGTSVRQITDAAKANLAAINYHFGSKEGLYTEVFARRVALIRAPIVDAADHHAHLARQDPARAFRAIGRAILAPLRDRQTSRRVVRLFARETVEAGLPPGLLVRELLFPVVEAITRVVSRTRPDLPEAEAKACARSFFGLLMHIVKGAVSTGMPANADLDHAVRFTVAGVRHLETDPRGRAASRRPAPRRPDGESR